MYKFIVNNLLLIFVIAFANTAIAKDYQKAKWDPIHFKPQIEMATDAQCLGCHQEILDRKVLQSSPAGVKSDQSMAWYQHLNTYSGEQDTFHRRHLLSEYSKKVMNLKCNTCHQGNDPREETANSSTTTPKDLTQRKMVNPDVCLLCHGKFNAAIMVGLNGDWRESGATFNNDCLACHIAIRKNRHNADFLNAGVIEVEGKKDSDVCYGCHGGRAWYAISYPYAKMPKKTPNAGK